ncbi:MAG: carboxypeptidase-like regulatory domain-containing protein [Daejeonella sp.]
MSDWRHSLKLLQTFANGQDNLPSAKVRKDIKGQITDVTGKRLPGVSIKIKETNGGTLSDLDGKYAISVDGENTILLFSLIGFKTQEINPYHQEK